MPTDTATVIAPEIESKALSWPEKATALVVADQAGYDAATEALKVVKGLAAEITGTFKPIIESAHRAHKVALDSQKKLVDPLNTAESLLKRKIGGYLDEQERIRLAEQRRLEEEARQRAEEEALAAAVQAEAELKQDGVAQEEIDEHTLSILDSAPEQAAPVVAPRTFQKAAGVSSTVRYSASVTDLKALMRAVLEGKAPATAVVADMTVLNGLARTLKDGMNYPGVRLVKDTSVAVRR